MIRGLSHFLRNCAGNTGMMLALALVPMGIAAGVAVDMVQTNNTLTVLNGASDAAALAGASSGETSQSKLDAIVEDYLRANGAMHVLDQIDSIEAKRDDAKRVFSVLIKGKRRTSLMQLAGFDSMDLHSFSEVALGGDGLEVALVLDVTASMNSAGRMPALKVAAKGIVDDLLEATENGAYVKMGIVPFAQYVNVGLSRRNANWLQVDDDSSVTDPNACWNTYPNAVSFNCVDVPYVIDGVDQGTTTQSCEWNYGTPVEVCGPSTNTITWNGCVGSRPDPKDVLISGATVDKYPGLMNAWCGTEIVTLTDDKDSLKTTIDSFTGVGETYIPQGLLWGWNMLDENPPLAEAKSAEWMADRKGTKALVLMTDGENTLYPDGQYHWTATSAAQRELANDKTAQLCENIKNDKIVVYTVSFMVTDPTALDLLQGCATDSTKSFSADNAAELAQAFKDIGDALMAMRLSK
jgi:Putative Flp pilus-assembly TadE/G-like